MLIEKTTMIDGVSVTPQPVYCPDCNIPMPLRTSKYGLFYGCPNYPTCEVTHGAHPDGRPLGFPADKETRALRRRCHELLDLIFDYKDKRQRAQMYAWLKNRTSTGHIGSLDKDELRVLEYSILEKLTVQRR